MADSSRIVQDEYLEWSVQRQSRNIIGDIYSVVMTCEGPEVGLVACMSHKHTRLTSI